MKQGAGTSDAIQRLSRRRLPRHARWLASILSPLRLWTAWQRQLRTRSCRGRGRAVASEYWGKVYTVLDSMRMRRSDGAMVRITTVNDLEPGAVQAAIDLATDLAAGSLAILPEFNPD
ncbi:MAG: exosortase-associated EpsI family protein [Acidobacteriota bacterium]